MERQQIFGDRAGEALLCFIKESKQQIREELDEHLDAINENTNEIQGNFEYIKKLDKKVEFLSEKMDEILFLLKGEQKEKSFTIKKLSKREKQVFQALYSLLHDQNNAITYAQIARSIGVSSSVAATFITNLIEKGVPVCKNYHNGVVQLSLDEEFRLLQAKNNILGLNTLLSAWIR